MKLEEYMRQFRDQIRDKHAREFVSEEIYRHIIDQAEDYKKQGMEPDLACARAVEDMGDPVSVGVSLDRIHRPHMEWRFLLYVIFISILSVGLHYVIGRNMPFTAGDVSLTAVWLPHAVQIFTGVLAMLIVYRMDYTVLAGRSRAIGGLYLIALSALMTFSGYGINGIKGWISIKSAFISCRPFYLLYVILFAGILYEYRGVKGFIFTRIFLWMTAPVISMIIGGYLSLPFCLFVLFTESILVLLAFRKKWYKIHVKSFLSVGLIFIVALSIMASFFIRFILRGNEYQKARLMTWLAHFGLGERPGIGFEGIGYINARLAEMLTHCNLLAGDDKAVQIMSELPSGKSGLILGSITANCGMIGAAGTLICLFVLSVYIFRISYRQKNQLGYIVGCASGILLGFRCITNILIIFGIIPMTDSNLPFFSGGLSYILVDYVFLGMVMSIYRYKDIRIEKRLVRLEALDQV